MYLDDKADKFKLQKDEVGDIKWLTKIEIEKLIKDKSFLELLEKSELNGSLSL